MHANVRYLLGRAGSGKSYRIMQEIVTDLNSNGDYPLLLLVPEQFTLQAERDLIEKMNLPGIMRVQVLSFTRLAYRVFNEVGGLTRTTISPQGKNMILRKVINENTKNLTIYKKASRQPGMVEKMSNLIAALKQQGISPEAFAQIQPESGTETITDQKLKDISLLYRDFNAFLQNRYLDNEDRVDLFIDKMENSEFIKSARIWIDGFTTYSHQSLSIIRQLMLLARQTTISFTINVDSDADSDLFSLTRKSYRMMREIARDCGLQEEVLECRPVLAASDKSPELRFIEKQIFSYPYKTYRAEVKNIQMFAATNIYSEIENLARRVLSLVRDYGCRWQDIAVVCNDIDAYGDLISRTFIQYGIPFFMDCKRDIMTNPLVQMVLSTLAVIERDYRCDDILRLLKTGLCNLTVNECDKLENYALQYGVNGKKWKQAFAWGENEAIAELNGMREKLIAPLEELQIKLEGKVTCRQITQSLFEFLEKLQVQEKLEAWIDNFTMRSEYELASENAQVWNIVMAIFDQMAEFLGDEEINLKDYSGILEAGFSSYEVGIIPTTVDQVLVGNIQRSKSRDIKALLVVGVNEGVLPSGQDDDDILSAQEKEQLQAKGLDLGYERELRSREERFLVYSAFSKPHKYLGFSWSWADREGKSMRPSILIDRLKKLFPAITVQSDLFRNREHQLQTVTTPGGTFNYLVNSLRDRFDRKPVEEFWEDVYGWFYNRSDWQGKCELVLKGLVHSNQQEYISPRQAQNLYGRTLYPSVSRLEKFVACPFAHFIRYGLNPRDRKMFTLEWPDMGEMLHLGLYGFSRVIKNKHIDWKNIKKSDCESIMQEVMDEIVDQQEEGVITSSYRYRYLGRRLQRIGCRTAWMLIQHLRQGDFIPAAFEVQFGRGGDFPPLVVELGDGHKMYLEGRIDRVDFLQADDATYIKIIDYKTGKKQLSLANVYYGLSLQLFIYMQAVLAMDNSQHALKPGGLFYFKIDDPIVNLDNITTSVENALAKEFRMQGLVLKDIDVVRHMDRNITGSSDIIPVELKLNKEFKKSSAVLNEEQFGAMLRHVTCLVKAMGLEIMQGKVAIEPVRKDKITACTYCPYGSICQFDRMLADNNYRILNNPGNETIMARIVKEGE